MRISILLPLGFFILIIFIQGIGYNSSKGIDRANQFIQSVFDGPTQSINFARTAQIDFSMLDYSLYRSFIENIPKVSVQKINDDFETLKSDLDVAKKKVISEDSKSTIDELQNNLTAWEKVKNSILNHSSNDFKTVSDLSTKIQNNFSDIAEFEATAAYQYVIDTQNKAYAISKSNKIFSNIATVIAILISSFLMFKILRPITESVKIAEHISKGDFSSKICLKRRDEFGKLLKALAVMQTDLIKEIEKRTALTISKQQEEAESQKQFFLKNISQELKTSMSKGLECVNSELSILNNISECLSFASTNALGETHTSVKNMHDIGTDMNSLLDATNKLSISINEISSQTSISSETAENASVKAQKANEAVSRLNSTSEEIGEVLQLITYIARKINLLSLNATIEAARSNEHGQSFAVVASEVKNLSNQTAGAIEKVHEKIQNVQNVAKDVTDAISEITLAISSLKDSSGCISNSINSQNAATNEISQMTQKTSEAIFKLIENINNVNTSSEETKVSSCEVLNTSQKLTEKMTDLNNTVDLISNKIEHS